MIDQDGDRRSKKFHKILTPNPNPLPWQRTRKTGKAQYKAMNAALSILRVPAPAVDCTTTFVSQKLSAKVDPVIFFAHLVWSPCKTWLLFLISFVSIQKVSGIWGTLGTHSLGRGHGWPAIETRHHPRVTTPNLAVLWQKVRAYNVRKSAFQASLCQWPTISDHWYTVGLSRTDSEKNVNFCRKSQIYLTPFIQPSHWGVPFGILWRQSG